MKTTTVTGNLWRQLSFMTKIAPTVKVWIAQTFLSGRWSSNSFSWAILDNSLLLSLWFWPPTSWRLITCFHVNSMGWRWVGLFPGVPTTLKSIASAESHTPFSCNTKNMKPEIQGLQLKLETNLQYKGRHWWLPMFLLRDKQASTPDLVLETREEALPQSNKEQNTQEHCAHTGWHTRCLIAYMWRSYRFAGELSLHSNLLQFLAMFTIIHDPFILPTWDGQVRKTSNPPRSRLPFEIQNLVSNISTPFKLISLLSILANCKTIYYTWLHSLWLIIYCSW